MIKKLLNNFTSRPFVVLLIAVIAFFVTDKFTESGLLVTFGLYCGYNIGNKIVEIKRNVDAVMPDSWWNENKKEVTPVKP